jgi:electron transfer flavoprotein beta subunit
MNILVLIKQTFDTEEKISLSNEQVQEDGVEFIINPYDEYAIEEAIRLRDENGGEVTVLTVGPARAESALRTALAMGADKAIIVDDESLFGDEFTIAKVLAAVIKRNSYDLIFAGNTSVDNGAGQIALRVAEEIGLPHVAAVTQLSIADGKATAVRDVEGDTEVVEIALPCLLTAQQGLNEPRYPSLPGIMKAKKKPLERLSAEDLGINSEDVAPKTQVVKQSLPASKQQGRIFSGDITDQVKELVHCIRNEAKVI